MPQANWRCQAKELNVLSKWTKKKQLAFDTDPLLPTFFKETKNSDAVSSQCSTNQLLTFRWSFYPILYMVFITSQKSITNSRDCKQIPENGKFQITCTFSVLKISTITSMRANVNINDIPTAYNPCFQLYWRLNLNCVLRLQNFQWSANMQTSEVISSKSVYVWQWH